MNPGHGHHSRCHISHRCKKHLASPKERFPSLGRLLQQIILSANDGSWTHRKSVESIIELYSMLISDLRSPLNGVELVASKIESFVARINSTWYTDILPLLNYPSVSKHSPTRYLSLYDIVVTLCDFLNWGSTDRWWTSYYGVSEQQIKAPPPVVTDIYNKTEQQSA